PALTARPQSDHAPQICRSCELLLHAVGKENPFALDVGTATVKKLPQLGSKIIAVWQWIECQIYFAARRETPLQIAEKKLPFARSPARVRPAISVKANRKCGDPVELLVKIRERLERLDPENGARHPKDFE